MIYSYKHVHLHYALMEDKLSSTNLHLKLGKQPNRVLLEIMILLLLNASQSI